MYQEQRYDIAEVCKMLGTTSRTLRFYEEKGLILHWNPAEISLPKIGGLPPPSRQKKKKSPAFARMPLSAKIPTRSINI